MRIQISRDELEDFSIEDIESALEYVLHHIEHEEANGRTMIKTDYQIDDTIVEVSDA